jgi:hypothetical protein
MSSINVTEKDLFGRTIVRVDINGTTHKFIELSPGKIAPIDSVASFVPETDGLLRRNDGVAVESFSPVICKPILKGASQEVVTIHEFPETNKPNAQTYTHISRWTFRKDHWTCSGKSVSIPGDISSVGEIVAPMLGFEIA